MEPARYLDLLRAEGALLAVTAKRDLYAPVPPCPGWAVHDVVHHTAEVYQHKIAAMRLGGPPGEAYAQEPPRGQDVVGWLQDSLDELVAELVERGPDAPSWTWWPEDQTVGFWYRRMAHETAVHRFDVQTAYDDTTPIDDELAVDGIDEVLVRFLAGDWSDMPPEEWNGVDPMAGAGCPIAVRTGDHAWQVHLLPDRVDVEPGHGPAHVTVTGEPSELLLWLWGRRPLSAVAHTGDLAVVEALRARLAITTQ